VPTALGMLHGLDFLFAEALFGSLVFVFAILKQGGVPEVRRIRRLFFLVALSSFVWMLFSSADMAESWGPSEVWTAMSTTDFGHLWCARVILLLLLGSSVWKVMRFRHGALVLVIGGMLMLLISSLSGHAAAGEARILRVGTDWIHAIAVGIWIGGLGNLYLWLGGEPTAGKSARDVVTSFSHFAMAGAAAITASGLLMAYWAGLDFLHPWESGRYGILLLWKVGIFCAALGLAAVNQFIHLRKSSSRTDSEFRRAIRREIGIEAVLVCLAILFAGFLARTELPGAGVNEEEHMSIGARANWLAGNPKQVP
jgi:putative copper export protein